MSVEQKKRKRTASAICVGKLNYFFLRFFFVFGFDDSNFFFSSFLFFLFYLILLYVGKVETMVLHRNDFAELCKNKVLDKKVLKSIEQMSSQYVSEMEMRQGIEIKDK